jgi:transposase
MHTTTNALRAIPGNVEPTVAWAGLDVAKATFDAALWLPECARAGLPIREMPVKTFPRTSQGAAEFLRWAEALLERRPRKPDALRAVLEATGKYSIELTMWLLELRADLAPAIINPKTSKDFMGSLALRNATDKIAARSLARYGADRTPAPYEPLGALQAELRDLCRWRQALVQARVAEENREQEGSASPLVRKMQQARIRQCKRDIAKVEKEIHRLIASNSALTNDVRTLDGIYGIGFITAATVLAELGDLRRFRKGRQLTAMAGLSPRRGESGASVRKKTRVCKQGSSWVRRALYLPVVAAVRGETELSAFYHRLIGAGKSPKAALVAVMRKILLVMRAILISGEPYLAHYRGCAKLREESA